MIILDGYRLPSLADLLILCIWIPTQTEATILPTMQRENNTISSMATACQPSRLAFLCL